MRPHSQLMMIVISIAFAIALSLAVALICISYLAEDPLPPIDTEPNDLPVFGTDVLPPAEETSSLPLPDQKDPSENDPYGGLRYESFGDGTCALSDVGSCTDACVVIPEYAPNGDCVIEISSRAFYGCPTVTAIQIPETVRFIGALAFADCPSLMFISVDADNTAYRDVEGVLYTKDLRLLILYPSRRAGDMLYIEKKTVEICDMAFYSCAYLESIRFEGSAAEWEMIRIGTKNYSLRAASKSFLDTKT